MLLHPHQGAVFWQLLPLTSAKTPPMSQGSPGSTQWTTQGHLGVSPRAMLPRTPGTEQRGENQPRVGMPAGQPRDRRVEEEKGKEGREGGRRQHSTDLPGMVFAALQLALGGGVGSSGGLGSWPAHLSKGLGGLSRESDPAKA